MASFSVVVLLVVFVSLAGQSTMAAETADKMNVRMEVKEQAKKSSDTGDDTGDGYEKKGDELLAILPLLFMMNGGQFVQCSVVVVMAAAALGMLGIQGMLKSPFHNHGCYDL